MPPFWHYYSSMRLKIKRLDSSIGLPEPATVGAAEEVLYRGGYNMILTNSRDRPDKEKEILDLFQRRRFDGMIITLSKEEDPATLRVLSESRIPTVLFERESTLPLDSVARLGRVADRLAEIGGPAEPPARLHGDLWAGNRMVDVDGVSWLIDPAAHGGHREFDLAMMRLFGGFGTSAFDAYHETFPLAGGWQERVSLHQLAPLLVHAIKFGAGYVAAVAGALDSII